MPVKRRVAKARITGLSATALAFFLDREQPADHNWELFVLQHDVLDFGCATASQLWERHRDELLDEFVRENPGKRPQAWWLRDAPRATDKSLLGWGTDDNHFLWRERPCEPRQRVGGIGDPAFLHLAYLPVFEFGIPLTWVTPSDVANYNGRSRDIHGNKIFTDYKDGDFLGVAPDPRDPPRFESQAKYLERHDLFLPGEKRRLTGKDFKPELLEIKDEIEEEIEDESDEPDSAA